MPDADKIAALEQQLADLRRHNNVLKLQTSQQARKIALLEETISSMQMKLDHANGF